MNLGKKQARAKLTLGPLLYNWPAALRRDFYFRIADEAPVDSVCLGEVVCAKRAPFIDPDLPMLAERLAAGGKEVVYSTLALVMDRRERLLVHELAQAPDLLIEANDLGAAHELAGRPHLIGPFVNVYNEATLAWLMRRGARRVSLPVELSSDCITALAAHVPEIELEVSVYGRLPLAISARCYHARAYGLHKDGCRYVCGEDPDGLPVDTIDGFGFLAVNGLQTLSHGAVCLAHEIKPLLAAGISHFRLWPHSADMVGIARIYRSLLDDGLEARQARQQIVRLTSFTPAVSGFIKSGPGAAAGEAE